MDPSGMYIVCSHSDKCLRVYNAVTGELSAQASGHAEVITGVAFLPDCRRLISVSFTIILCNHILNQCKLGDK